MKTAFRLIAASTIAAMLSGCALDGMNKMTTYGGVGA